MSTLFVNNLNTASGDTITVPTGKKLVVTDTGGLDVPGLTLQTVSSTITAWTPTQSTSLISTGLETTITPKFSSSKVLIRLSINGCYTVNAATYLIFNLYKNDSNLHSFSTASGQAGANTASDTQYALFCGHEFLDSPSTTSATKYTLYYRSSNGSDVGINNYALGGNNSTRSTITAQEIAQ